MLVVMKNVLYTGARALSIYIYICIMMCRQTHLLVLLHFTEYHGTNEMKEVEKKNIKNKKVKNCLPLVESNNNFGIFMLERL